MNSYNFYKETGWAHLENQISKDIVDELRTRSIKLKKWLKDRIGQPAEYGPSHHWNGLGCAGMYDDYLMNFYKSKFMINLASKFLDTKDVWIYNDQVVVKESNESFRFVKHTDNTAGGGINEGKNTINFCIILDDFTDKNGGLQIRDTKVYPKAGDIVAIHGDTPHQSGVNNSDKDRCLYACVYSDEKLVFQNYYKTKITNSLI
jgi:hypothetical protein